MTIKIDSIELFSKDFLLEVPKYYEAAQEKILERFFDISNMNSPAQLSSFRTPAKFKMDLEKAVELATEFRKKYDRLIVLGTGGSSLGTKAVIEALKPKVDRKIYFIENLDASDLPELNTQDLKKTAVVAISKSGNTLETLVALQHYAERFTDAHLVLSQHFVAITDEKSQAPLAQWATQNDIKILHMDVLLGGRWSVSSAVGAFPLSFCGRDAKALIHAFEKRFLKMPNAESVALALRFADCDRADLNIHSLWLYSSRLKEVGSWWKQLWSESLGKKKDSTFVGAFACPATGAVDQHSVLQQMTEGRNDAYTGFVYVEYNSNTLEVKKLDPIFATKIAFAENKTWHQLLQAQGVATRQSLVLSGRGTYALHLHDISEASVGELMAFWMDVTALAGTALEVNPFDQPGVELGKKILPKYI